MFLFSQRLEGMLSRGHDHSVIAWVGGEFGSYSMGISAGDEGGNVEDVYEQQLAVKVSITGGRSTGDNSDN